MAEASDSAHHREEVCPQCHEIHESTNRTSSAQPQGLQWSKSPKSSGLEKKVEELMFQVVDHEEETHPLKAWRGVVASRGGSRPSAGHASLGRQALNAATVRPSLLATRSGRTEW